MTGTGSGAVAARTWPVRGARHAVVFGIAAAGSLALVLAGSTAVSAAAPYEVPSHRTVEQVLPKDLSAGPSFRVAQVASYGYLNHYIVNSDFGTFQVTGNYGLRKLVTEIAVIRQLRKVSSSRAYAQALGKAVEQPIEFGKRLFDEPVEALSGIPRGIGQLFGNIGSAVSSSRDPSQDSQMKEALQVSAWKRDYCRKFACDAYSSNKVLQDELNRVGWASAVGGLTFSMATTAISGPVSMAISQARLSQQLNDLLAAEPPPRLRIINRDKLAAIGVAPALAEKFLDSPAFTPRHDTVIVAALEQLNGAAGRDRFLEFALGAKDEVSANFLQNTADLLRSYHAKVSPIRQIDVPDGVVVALAANGRALIPFPLDYGIWTEKAETRVKALIAQYRAQGFRGGFDLWLTGSLSPRARKELAALGLETKDGKALAKLAELR